MAKIEPGTDRWGAIWAKAESLRSAGKLNYVNLKVAATCGGDVAQRVIEALKAADGDGVEAGTVQTDEDTPPGKLPAQLQARWEACARTQHEIAVEVMQTLQAEQATRQTSEFTRHHAELGELHINLHATLEDVRLYSDAASDAQEKLEQSDAQNVEIQAKLTDALAKVTQVDGDLEWLREKEATAQSDRTAATVACARAEAEAEHWRRRAEPAEDALEKSRTALEAVNIRVARLEGELDAGLRAQKSLQELLQSQTDSRGARALHTHTKVAKPGK